MISTPRSKSSWTVRWGPALRAPPPLDPLHLLLRLQQPPHLPGSQRQTPAGRRVALTGLPSSMRIRRQQSSEGIIRQRIMLMQVMYAVSDRLYWRLTLTADDIGLVRVHPQLARGVHRCGPMCLWNIAIGSQQFMILTRSIFICMMCNVAKPGSVPHPTSHMRGRGGGVTFDSPGLFQLRFTFWVHHLKLQHLHWSLLHGTHSTVRMSHGVHP